MGHRQDLVDGTDPAALIWARLIGRGLFGSPDETGTLGDVSREGIHKRARSATLVVVPCTMRAGNSPITGTNRISRDHC